MKTLQILCVILLTAGLIGCGKDRPLQGKWVFDRQYTESQLPEAPEKPQGSPSELDALKAPLVAMLIPQLIEKLDGCTLTVTSKEMVMTTRDGNGQANDYEVLERPDDHTWRVKGTDGKIETYTREGDRLSLMSTGDVHVKAYFKPAGK